MLRLLKLVMPKSSNELKRTEKLNNAKYKPYDSEPTIFCTLLSMPKNQKGFTRTLSKMSRKILKRNCFFKSVIFHQIYYKSEDKEWEVGNMRRNAGKTLPEIFQTRNCLCKRCLNFSRVNIACAISFLKISRYKNA